MWERLGACHTACKPERAKLMSQSTGGFSGVASRAGTVARRDFLKGAGAALGLAAVSRRADAAGLGADDARPVVLGVIGCGRRGVQLIEAAATVGAAISMVCDVDALRLRAAVELVQRLTGRRPVETSDYRDVVENDLLEGVVIATPDHWHATPFLAACAARKDIYVEAPLALQDHEAAAMIYATHKYKRVVQVGMQYRSCSAVAEAARIASSGTIGRIAQTRTWGFVQQSAQPKVKDGDPPVSIDYDRWMGPAPKRAYNAARVQQPMHFWDYGGGEAAAWNVHLQDMVNNAMRVTVPRSVVAVGGNYGLNDFRETPDTLDVLIEYTRPQGNFVQAFSMRLSNAYAGWGPAALPAVPERANVGGGDINASGGLPARSGVQFFGSEKTLYVSGSRLLLLPAGANSAIEDLTFLGIGEKAKPTSAPAIDPLTVAHMKDFVQCVRGRKEPSGNIEAARIALLPCIAANIAYRVGRKLYVHPESHLFFTDPRLEKADEEANKLMRRGERKPYLAPAV